MLAFFMNGLAAAMDSDLAALADIMKNWMNSLERTSDRGCNVSDVT